MDFRKILILLVAFSFVSCSVNIDPSIANTPFGMSALRYEYIIALISLFGGIGCLVAGILLTILGFTGSVEWIIEASGFVSRLTNASPGMIIGGFLTYKSRLKVSSRKSDVNDKED